MLINCVAYENGAKLADISVEDISDYINRPGCFVWVALSDASDEELSEMQKEFNLHPLAVEDAHHGHQRPKVEEYGDSLFVVMHLVEPSPEGEHCTNVGEVDVFVGTNYVLSVRNRSKQGFLGVRERCEREPDLLRNGAGLRAVRADGRGGRPLLSGDRRASRWSWRPSSSRSSARAARRATRSSSCTT
jgi:magnesium transporter